MEYVSFPSLFGDDRHDEILRSLSVYATLRGTDQSTLLGEKSKKKKKSHENLGLSLQNLFVGQSPYEPDFQPPYIREVDESSTSSSEDLSTESSFTVYGSDVKDLPVQYTVEGLKPHEKPVIGFYIAPEICPGFKYKVRMIGSNDYAFDGTIRTLMSIGMGYGKRLTFKGDKLNENDCVFWSDSLPEGFGFSIVALEGGETFTMYNDRNQAIATVVVDKVDFPQVEKSMTTKNGTVRKFVQVRFSCSLDLRSSHHGKTLGVRGLDNIVLNGVVELVKEKRDREAKIVGIPNVYVPMFGECSLWKE